MLCPLSRTSVVSSHVKPLACLAIGYWSDYDAMYRFYLVETWITSNQKVAKFSNDIYARLEGDIQESHTDV